MYRSSKYNTGLTNFSHRPTVKLKYSNKFMSTDHTQDIKKTNAIETFRSPTPFAPIIILFQAGSGYTISPE